MMLDVKIVSQRRWDIVLKRVDDKFIPDFDAMEKDRNYPQRVLNKIKSIADDDGCIDDKIQFYNETLEERIREIFQYNNINRDNLVKVIYNHETEYTNPSAVIIWECSTR